MTHVTVAGLRRITDQLGYLPDDAIVDIEALAGWGCALVHDREEGIYVEARLNVEDLPDE